MNLKQIIAESDSHIGSLLSYANPDDRKMLWGSLVVFLRERDRKILEGVKKDLLEIADSGEYEELRREAEHYFSRILI